MKRHLSYVTISAILIATMFGSQLATAERALVITLDICPIINSKGVSEEASGKAVITMSANGNIQVVCHGEITNADGKAVVTKGSDHPNVTCGIDLLNDDPDLGLLKTTDWKSVVSASGQGTLSCHFKAPYTG